MQLYLLFDNLLLTNNVFNIEIILIINQALTTGVSPDNMNISKVKPYHIKKMMRIFNNYSL